MVAFSKRYVAFFGTVIEPTLDALVHDVKLADAAFCNLGVVSPRGNTEDLFDFKQLFGLVLRSLNLLFVFRIYHGD